MKRTALRTGSAWLWGCALFLGGCEGRDARLERITAQSLTQQAAQNAEMARLHQDVTSGTRELVEANAESRAEFAAMQDQLQAQQALVGQQRDLLEHERKNVATERRREQLLGIALENFGLLLAALAPLLLAAFVVFLSARATGGEGVTELLVQDLTSTHPLLLAPPSPPALNRPNTSAAPPQVHSE